MLSILLIKPGSTDFDEEGRIKGTLDVPMNLHGTEQVARTIGELEHASIDAIYMAPGQSCRETATALADGRDVKTKRLEALRNLDHGLWHGKLIEEVKQKQPKVYRQCQERPQTVCPPEGEPLQSAQQRVSGVLVKLGKKHKDGVIALVVPEPLASLVRTTLNDTELGNLWQAECDNGGWEEIKVGRLNVVTSDNGSS